MNISQENRVIAAVERFEAMERDIAAKKPVPKTKRAPRKPKDLTPIEIKKKKQADADKIEAKALMKAKAEKEKEAKANAKTDAGKLNRGNMDEKE